VNAYRVKSGWSCGWQVKLCDPVNTCHFELRDCLGCKNALYAVPPTLLTLLYSALTGGELDVDVAVEVSLCERVSVDSVS